MVLVGFGGWGLSGSRRLRDRARHLQDLQTAIAFLEKEITCMMTPLSQALANTARFSPDPVSKLFAVSAAILQEKSGTKAREAWTRGIEELARYSQLKDLDLQILRNGAVQLGASDVIQQQKFLSLMQEQLRINEKRARLQAEAEQKLYAYGGFIVGAVVVLLLL